MKYDLKNNKYFRWGLTAFLTIAASICFYYLLFHGNSIKSGFRTITGILADAAQRHTDQNGHNTDLHGYPQTLQQAEHVRAFE